ncbi:MAG: hypothetical protein KME22_31245 [Hassallia sp. WJT32-NPBG1]|nr:hypothetical protein [Hassallia sp. WJT32-NPBG1]
MKKISITRNEKFFFPSIFLSAFGLVFLLSPLAVVVNYGDPNSGGNIPEPGWSLWHPKVEIKNADIDSGFSN